MLANYLIGLREGLEAALVVSILVAYLVRTDRRALLRQVWFGVGIAVGVSIGLGAILTLGPQGLSFEAQEAIGGALSIVAVGLITWMIFWMGRTARHLKGHLENALENAIAVGKGAVIAMALLAVGREGLETALFLWAGITAAGSTWVPIVGATLGIATAVGLGFLMYKGAVKVNLRVFFQWTGVFLILVAGGVLAYGVHDLQEAGLLPGLNTLAFDISSAVPAGSVHGTLLKGIFNISPQTTVLEAVAWVAYVVPVMWLFVRMAFRSGPPRPQPAAASSRDLAAAGA
ncbi:iron uptake transporter permease EfeU [Demequina sp. SYSU T00192]|uniref:Iron uptake transporter permease EfeU n=1 Tax=Demequina litoralis TaxID=3051660 RepID=A0ABT8GBT1_9MICO|nr:iron uptake transporter permease EfeU [Demequina sp. SYSU T00192]MDN4476597.1 iron uptake transporter permease EfeU [Demequina sp. SYSU T00192]